MYAKKGFVSRNIQGTLKTHQWKTIQADNGKEIQGYFTKDNVQMTNKHKKRYSKSATIGEMKKTTKECYYGPSVVATIKHGDTTRGCWGHGRTGSATLV